MPRPPIVIKNTDKSGKVTRKWFIRVGSKSRLIDQSNIAEGLAWLDKQLGGRSDRR